MDALSDASLPQLLLRFAAFLVAAGVHGWALARAARWQGDAGPKHDGRETPNPLPHLGLLGTVSAVLFSLPWIKPVVPDPAALRRARLGPVLLVLAALAANLAFAALLSGSRQAIVALVPADAGRAALIVVEALVEANLWLVAVAALPAPPFTLGLLWTLGGLVSRDRWLRLSGPFAAVAFAAAVAFDLRPVLRPVFDVLGTIVRYG